MEVMFNYEDRCQYTRLTREDLSVVINRHYRPDKKWTTEYMSEMLIKFYTRIKYLDNWILTGALGKIFPTLFDDEGSQLRDLTPDAQGIHRTLSSMEDGAKGWLENHNFSDGEHFAGVVYDAANMSYTGVHSDYFTKEPPREPAETAAANPVESPVEPTTEPVPEGEFPLTMAQVSRKVSPFGGKLKSKYEFGQFAIKKPRGVPSLERALREYTRHHVFAIARALIMRKYGIQVAKDEVLTAANGAFKTYSNTAPYRAVMKEHREDSDTSKAVENVSRLYEKVLDGNVDLDWKKFRKNDTYGKPWDIGSFFIYMTDGLHISPKAVAKRKSKKK